MMSTELLASQMGAGKYSKPIEDACIRWGIVEGRDKARFIAQLYVESDGFRHVAENLNYSAKRLAQVFGGRNGLTPARAEILAGIGPKAIANFIYGGEWGRKNLGNTQPNDGWDFRGRGLIMLTGRANYQRMSLEAYGNDRLLVDPDDLLMPEVAADTAACFWHRQRLNGITDVAVVTKKINGGQMGLAERIAQTNRAYNLLIRMTEGR